MTVLLTKGGLAPHYLEKELRQLVASDPTMWDFLQQGSLDGVWYWDLEKPDSGWMSPEFWKLLGIDPTSKTHDPSSWQDLMFPDDLILEQENFDKHCADPNHPYDQIMRYRHADGSTVWVHCRGMAIRDQNGRPVRMLGAHNDLTAVKRAEEEVRRERDKLKLANEELLAFTYGVSHDLKSPSRTALQLVQEGMLADEGNLSKDQRELFEGAISTLLRMQAQIADLLDYGILVGEKQPERPIPLRDVVREIVQDLSYDLSSVGGSVEIADLPTISGYHSQLSMLIKAMVTNALKYRRDDVCPVLKIACEPTDGRVVPISFQDNGRGIPEDQFDNIFGVFTRLHRHDEIYGTGVGLAVCKRVALNHDATISVSSCLGVGSKFTLNMPQRRVLS